MSGQGIAGLLTSMWYEKPPIRRSVKCILFGIKLYLYHGKTVLASAGLSDRTLLLFVFSAKAQLRKILVSIFNSQH